MYVTLLGPVEVDALSHRAVPLYSESVPCGFPSPAAGYEDTRLDLNELCIPRPSSTYMVRCDGDSMSGIGIYAIRPDCASVGRRDWSRFYRLWYAYDAPD